MKKIIPSVSITGLMLFLPLWNNFDLMLNPKLLFPTIVSLWLLLKQRELDFKKVQENVMTDKNSTWLIVLAGMISQATPIFEWQFKLEGCGVCFKSINYLGVLMLFGGLFLRLQSIEELKEFFTNEVRVGKDWKLIKTGTYSYIRHPSYLGAYLTMLGTSVLFESYLSLIFSSILLMIVYAFRIRLEEKTLMKHFGEEYMEYKKKTKAIFPFLF